MTKEKALKQMVVFLNANLPKDSDFKVRSVSEIKVKKEDDDTGTIGEHYVVKYFPSYPDEKVETNLYKTCIVNRSGFNDWVKNNSIVIW